MDYRISKLTLQNFCGVKSLEITPNGADTAIFGDNATGKTTIANAFSWLFTGKNSAGTAELDPAPLDSSNGKIHNLETAVTVEFTDGTEFSRVLSEVWSKKRGAVTAELTGTKTAYYRNGVPMKEKEFGAAVEELFGSPEQFRVLAVGGYFPAVMDWKARRKLLVEMCGDISDSDVTAVCPELSELSEILGGKTVDDYLKIAKSKKAELRKEIDLIPARITENQNAMVNNAVCEGTEELEAAVGALEQREKDITAKITACRTPSAADDRRNALKQELERRHTEYLKAYNIKLGEYNSRLSALSAQRDELYSERSPLLIKKSELPHRINEMKKLRERLIAEHAEVSARTYDGGDTCPCCGQKLPPEHIEKAVEEFNRRKSEELAAISEKAKTTCHKDMIAALEAELEALTVRITELDEKYNAITSEIETLRAEKPVSAFEQTAEYADLTAQIAAVKGDEVIVPAELTEQQERVSRKLAEAKELLYKSKACQSSKARIAELEEQQKTLAAAYAEYEKGEYLCEVFIRTKVSMLDERINSRFCTLKFKLFHEQQNGGLQEICKVLIPCESGLVEFEKANNAARINAGLEIIDVLSEHFGVRLPVFVDNAESVTELAPFGGQMIRLVVSEADKQLRTEYDA